MAVVAVVAALLPGALQPVEAAPAVPGVTAQADAAGVTAQWEELQARAEAADAPDSDLAYDGSPDPDGLADPVERIVGTDPERSDSDGDSLSDRDELQGGLDPTEPDSNFDGITDNVEIYDESGDLDWALVDANAWNDDNDGDGVTDAVDNSPSTQSGVSDEFHVSVSTGDRPTYLDLQVVPDDPGLLRDLGAGFDWLDGDDQGQMQDDSQSPGTPERDVTIVPTLELVVEDREAIEAAVAAESALTGWNAFERYGIQVPVEPEPDEWVLSRARVPAGLDAEGRFGELFLYGTGRDELMGATGVVAGPQQTCVTRAGGQLWCWGDNRSGELGTGAPGRYYYEGDPANGDVGIVATGMVEPATEPYPVDLDFGVGRVAPVLDLSGDHTCVVDESKGTLYCWGENGSAQVNGPWYPQNVLDLVPALGVGSDFHPGLVVDTVATGRAHTCAAGTEAGQRKVYCRGENTAYQLAGGFGSAHSDWVEPNQEWLAEGWELPVVTPYVGPSHPEPVLATGSDHTCAIIDVGGAPVVACWGGLNEAGQVGTDFPPGASTVALAGGATPADLALGERHSCVLTTEGDVQCWGDWASGSSRVPVPVDLGLAADEQVVELSAGLRHTCARTSDQRMICWGANESGQLGNGSVGGPQGPTPVALGLGADGSVTSIAAGGGHTCAVTTGTRDGDGAVRCWGSNGRGELGIGGTAVPGTPAFPAVSGVSTPTRVGGLRREYMVGYGVERGPDGLGRAQNWSPGFESAYWSDPIALPDLPAANSFPTGLGEPAPQLVDLDRDGTEDYFISASDPLTGQLHYVVGKGLGGDAFAWSGPHAGPTTLERGGQGSTATLADVDGDGPLDIVVIALDDARRHRYRTQVGFDLAPDGSVGSWSETFDNQGNSLHDVIQVPLVPVLNTTGEKEALAGRMYLPGGLPDGFDLDADVRLRWTVIGDTDTPDAPDTVPLARYSGGFRLTGIEATEHLAFDVGTFTPAPQTDPATGNIDAEDRWTQITQTGLELSDYWLTGPDTGTDELGLAEVPQRLSALGVQPLPLCEGTDCVDPVVGYSHPDEGAVGSDQVLASLLASTPAGDPSSDAVPVVLANEHTSRSTNLGDADRARWSGDTDVAIDLAAAPSITLKSFKLRTYDLTNGEEAVELGAGIVGEVQSWNLSDEAEEMMIGLLANWSAGDMTVAAVDGQGLARQGTDDATMQRIQAAIGHDGWVALASAGVLPDVEAARTARTALVEPASSGVAGAVDYLERNWDDFTASVRGKLAGSATEALDAFIGKVTPTPGGKWAKFFNGIGKAAVVLEVALIGVSFLTTWLAYGGNLGVASAVAGLIYDIMILAVDVALTAALGALLPFFVSNPAGWVAGVIVGLLLVVYAILDAVFGWGDDLKELMVAAFFDAEDLVIFSTEFTNMGVLVEDGDANGIDVGDYLGMEGDLYSGIRPVDPSGEDRTYVRDLSRSFLASGMRLSTTEPTGRWHDVPAPTREHDGSWPEPRRYPTHAWAQPVQPDHDFSFDVKIETTGLVRVWEEVLGVVERVRYDLDGDEADDATPGASLPTETNDPVPHHFDVMPGSISDFVNWDDGTRLLEGWSAAHPLDADGDGLAGTQEASIGTSDSVSDTDGDALSDWFEVVALAPAGAAGTDPNVADSDSDGLDDGDEVEIGTDPRYPDTDRDGLTDHEELEGWDVEFDFEGQAVLAHVTSDPVDADSDRSHLGDGDAVGDLREQQLGLNPRSSDTDGDGTLDGACDADHLAVVLSGAFTGRYDGCVTAGNVTVRRDGFGVLSVTGTVSMPSLGADPSVSARAAFDLRRFWILPRYLGTVRVLDRPAGIDGTATAIFSPLTASGDSVAAVLTGVTGTFPRLRTFTLSFTLDDTT